ncbi:hypothetical protein HDU91_005181 [Kappamyces sp. JEL0680]|nr:hypothetical protein HDU91_005181 [Kappamyces sp. JEL0680]
MCLYEFSKTTECAGWNAVAVQDPVIAAIPSARNVSNQIYSICNEMPMMADCATCPPPSASTGVSDCPLFATYSKLCLEMPDMAQCKRFNDFCALAPSSSFCKAAGSATTVTGSPADSLFGNYCAGSDTLCVSMNSTASGTSCFNVSSKADGWVGLGFGSIMAGADIYVAWRNAAGDLQIGNFQGNGPVQPTPRDSQKAILSMALLSSGTPSWAKFSYSFCRSDSLYGAKVSSLTTPFIYAWEPSKPTGDSISTTTFSFHSGGYDAFLFSPSTAGASINKSGGATNTASFISIVLALCLSILWQ